jgi:hypothetical protein
MSYSVAYRHVLAWFFKSSGKHVETRISIYLLRVFPNVTLRPSGATPGRGWLL